MKEKQLLLNTEKTEIFLFDDNSVSYIDFLNTKVEVKRTAKFLGIQLDTFNEHIFLKYAPQYTHCLLYTSPSPRD